MSASEYVGSVVLDAADERMGDLEHLAQEAPTTPFSCELRATLREYRDGGMRVGALLTRKRKPSKAFREHVGELSERLPADVRSLYQRRYGLLGSEPQTLRDLAREEGVEPSIITSKLKGAGKRMAHYIDTVSLPQLDAPAPLPQPAREVHVESPVVEEPAVVEGYAEVTLLEKGLDQYRASGLSLQAFCDREDSSSAMMVELYAFIRSSTADWPRAKSGVVFDRLVPERERQGPAALGTQYGMPTRDMKELRRDGLRELETLLKNVTPNQMSRKQTPRTVRVVSSQKKGPLRLFSHRIDDDAPSEVAAKVGYDSGSAQPFYSRVRDLEKVCDPGAGPELPDVQVAPSSEIWALPGRDKLTEPVLRLIGQYVDCVLEDDALRERVLTQARHLPFAARQMVTADAQGDSKPDSYWTAKDASLVVDKIRDRSWLALIIRDCGLEGVAALYARHYPEGEDLYGGNVVDL